MAEVFLLGAGFSRAISEQMPLVRDLIEPLAEFFASADRTKGFAPLIRQHPDLEAWLTYLAEGQSWLDESEKLAGQSAFVAATDWLAEYVYEHQRHVLGSAAPPWLLQLVQAWHEQNATVITLNYDTLVEATAETLGVLGTVEGGSRLSYLDVLQANLPRVRNRRHGRASFLSREPIPSFRLIKLHGSLNWASARRSTVGGEYQEVWDTECVDAFEAMSRKPWAEVREELRDLRPLIIPPVTGKSPFLGGDWIRPLWVEAADALKSTGRLTIIGYSLPMSDIAMRLLLMTTVSSQQVRTVNVDSSFEEHLFEATGISAENSWSDVEAFVQEDTGS